MSNPTTSLREAIYAEVVNAYSLGVGNTITGNKLDEQKDIAAYTDKIMSLVEDFTSPKKHLKRDDWMSVCGGVNITSGEFVEIIDDATCLRCIRISAAKSQSQKEGE